MRPLRPPTPIWGQVTTAASCKRLKAVNGRISMEGKEHSSDNVFVERLWGTLYYDGVSGDWGKGVGLFKYIGDGFRSQGSELEAR